MLLPVAGAAPVCVLGTLSTCTTVMVLARPVSKEVVFKPTHSLLCHQLLLLLPLLPADLLNVRVLQLILLENQVLCEEVVPLLLESLTLRHLLFTL